MTGAARGVAPLCALAMLAALGRPATAQQVSATNEMFAPARAVAAAINTSRIAQLEGVFSRDARIMAGFAPYRWSGKTAGEDWLNAFDATMSAAGASNIKLDVWRPAKADLNRDAARYVAPVIMTYDVGKKHVRRVSSWSLVVVNRGARWVVTALTWTALTRGQ